MNPLTASNMRTLCRWHRIHSSSSFSRIQHCTWRIWKTKSVALCMSLCAIDKHFGEAHEKRCTTSAAAKLREPWSKSSRNRNTHVNACQKSAVTLLSLNFFQVVLSAGFFLYKNPWKNEYWKRWRPVPFPMSCPPNAQPIPCQRHISSWFHDQSIKCKQCNAPKAKTNI